MNFDSFSYTKVITDNLKKIAVLSHEFNQLKLSDIVLMEMQQSAHALSAYTSTSIEGNPLPLTEVKKILKNNPSSKRESEIEVLNYNNTLVWLNCQIS